MYIIKLEITKDCLYSSFWDGNKWTVRYDKSKLFATSDEARKHAIEKKLIGGVVQDAENITRRA